MDRRTTFPFLKTIDVHDATATLAEHVQRLDNEPLVVTKRGKLIAALVPVNGTDLEALSLSTDPDFLDLIERSRRRHREEGGVSLDEVRRELESTPKERRTRRKEQPARS